MALKFELPRELHDRLRELVAQGWFSSEADVVQEAVRRFLEARAPEMMSSFIEEELSGASGVVTERVACDAGPLTHLDQLS